MDLKEKYPSNFKGNYHPHSFRHSKGTHLYNNGTPLLYIKDFLGHSTISTTEIYATPDTKKQREQILNNAKEIKVKNRYTNSKKENLENYLKQTNQEYEIISDIGSGINYNKPGLKKLIEKINKKEVDEIVVLYKDRLLRFGFELVEHFASLNNVRIEVLDKIDKTQDEELVEDLVQIITLFSCKIQGKRKSKTKQILEDFSQKIQETNS